MNLILVGVRGSGKSSLGSRLASSLKLTFVDLDQEVENLADRTIKEIFSRQGEQAFRDLETQALAKLIGKDRMLLATGGGVVLALTNRNILRRLGVVVWLQVSPRQALKRIQGSTHRPPLTGLSALEEARLLAEQRGRMYAQVADQVIDTNDKIFQEVRDELQQLWRSLTHDNLR